MTTQERVESLHARMDALRRTRERRKTGLLAATSVALTLCLVFLIFGAGGQHLGGSAGMYSGSTMLFDGAGLYVLIAIIAFMIGVIVTVVIMRKRHTNSIISSNNIRSQNKDSN